MKYVVNTHEVGLLFKNNSFIRALPSKTYHMVPFSQKWILPVDMSGKFDPSYELNLFLKDPMLAKMLDVICLKDHELALHYVDGNFCDVLAFGTHAFFNIIKKHSFVLLDTNQPFLPEEVDLNIFNKEYFRKEGFKHILGYAIPTGKKGILSVNAQGA